MVFQDIAAPVQDAPLMGKFKLKGKGEKHKIKAAKQQISVEPSNLMNGEDGKYRQFFNCVHTAKSRENSDMSLEYKMTLS